MFVIEFNKTIYNVTIKDAAAEIGESKYGLHCLLIYPNLKTFREFYTYYIGKQIKTKDEIILFNPFYETTGLVRQNLLMGHIQLDEFQYESDISLIITDSLKQYFGKVSMAEFKDRLVKFAVEKRKDGVSIMSYMGSYFFKRLYSELVDYELSLPIQFDAPLKGVCIHNEFEFDNRLTEKQKLNLVNHHGMAIKLGSID